MEQRSFIELLMARRDVRGNNFLNTPIQQQELDTILHAAAIAPSVGLSQPWKFVIVRDTEIRKTIHSNCVKEKIKQQSVLMKHESLTTTI